MSPVWSRLNRFQASRPGERLSEPLGVEEGVVVSTLSSVTSSGAAAEGVGRVMVLRARRGQGLRRALPTGYAGLFQRNSCKVNKIWPPLGLSLLSLPRLDSSITTRVARRSRSVSRNGPTALIGQGVRYADAGVSECVHPADVIQRFRIEP